MSAEETSGKLMWFLAGVALGAGIALLYAPASGLQTRRYITKKTEQGREALRETGKDLLDRGREYYEKGRKLAEEAGELFDRGRKLVKG